MQIAGGAEGAISTFVSEPNSALSLSGDKALVAVAPNARWIMHPPVTVSPPVKSEGAIEVEGGGAVTFRNSVLLRAISAYVSPHSFNFSLNLDRSVSASVCCCHQS
jgi:hypothetical protein